MNSSTLVLHHYWRSSSSWRVRWALALKGLEYQSKPVNLLQGEQTGEAFQQASPLGYVPCLVIDGRPISESVAILELLDGLYPTPVLYPDDPWQCARVRQLVELINAGIQPLQNLHVLRHLSSDAAVQTAWSRHFIERGLVALERELEAIQREFGVTTHAVGQTITAAELFLVPQIYNARRFGVNLEPFPLTIAIEQTALATAAAQLSHPDRFSPS